MAFRIVIIGLLAITNLLKAEIVINEIHYNAEPNTAKDEFIELSNTGDETVDLSGWFFNAGVRYVFPSGSKLDPGEFAVIAEDPPSMLARYGVDAFGPYEGALSGSGETIELRQSNGLITDCVSYTNHFPWPVAAGGEGSSMELINPSLDNDLGGSWRSSQVIVLPEKVLLEASAPNWSWRRGISEASDPVTAWTNPDFVQDKSWSQQAMPIGFGGVGSEVFNPAITGMRSVHTSVFFRNEFAIAEGEIPSKLLLRYVADDGIVVYLNGNEVFRSETMPQGALSFDATAETGGNETWLETQLVGVSGFLVEGSNTIAIQGFNATIGSSDFGVNIELIRPATDPEVAPAPSPGMANTVFSQNAPPAIRQVSHSPKSPRGGEDVVVQAKVTDPDGVSLVMLEAQVVAPGSYVPAFLAKTTSSLLANPNGPRTPNPAYEQGWTAYEMKDDGVFPDEQQGDGIYTISLSGEAHRHLVRYRILVRDSLNEKVRVPYADDDRLNFAYYHYDGVPDFRGASTNHLAGEITKVPVYQVLTTAPDFNQAMGTSGADRIPSNNYDARSAYNWNCTFVYDGEVYDHAQYRLRQRNARYSGSGKRSLKFRFNRGNYPQFRDRNGKKYPQAWKLLAMHKMVGSRSNQLWGLDQASNHLMWNLTGTPAPYTHWAHMRVVKGANEAPSVTGGDFYGMLLALEEYDSRFLDSHKLAKGNLYKLISYRTNGLDVQRYQAADAVDDGSDFSNIIRQLRPERTDQWLNEHVNWESWNHYHAIVDLIRHYDVQPNLAEHLKNRAYYFEPSATNPLGRLHVLPWDSDTSWGPNWNAGVDFPKQAIFGASGVGTRSPFTIEYLNTMREMRDLLWQEDQIDLVIDPLASRIEELVEADRSRWPNGNLGSGRDPSLESVVANMKRFAFTGGSWVGGNNAGMPLISRDSGASGQSGRDAYVDALTSDSLAPAKPEISYSGVPGYPVDGLAFSSSSFSDAQGSGSFQAMEWRLSEITVPGGATRSIMAPGRVWSYLDNNVDQGSSWKEPNFDDMSWSTGPAPFGFGSVDGLDFGTTISSGIATAYFRTTIHIEDLENIDHFIFKLLLDDSAVVWVNGKEALRDGFSSATTVTHASLAEVSGDESSFDEFEVDQSLFVEGINVLAIEVHNRSITNNDLGFEMSIDAVERLVPANEDPKFEWTSIWQSGELSEFKESIELSAVTKVGRTYRARVRHQDDTGRWSNWSQALQFAATEPSIQPYLDSLVISKVMYHPVAPQAQELLAIPDLEQSDFEWIEIMNIGNVELDLSEVRFTKGIEFDFITGSRLSITPGERLLIVGRQEAFNLRHGYLETPAFVVGEFSKNLSNSGELVKLSFGAGTLIRELTYQDQYPWPTGADGSGASLVLVDGFGELGSDWRQSVGSLGAPGIDDSVSFTGEAHELLGYAIRSELRVQPIHVDGQSFVEVTFMRQINADDALLTFQGSPHLNQWINLNEFKTSELQGVGGLGTSVYQVPQSLGMNFFRVKVERR